VPVFRRLLGHLQRCHGDWLAQVAFHVVSSGRERRRRKTPAARRPAADSPVTDSSAFNSPFNCSSPLQHVLRHMLRAVPPQANKWETGSVYPQNHMRNVARKGCPSTYVLLLDVDIVPTQDMAKSLATFLRLPSVERCHRCAYVLPTYELDVSAIFPRNKKQLAALEDAGRAQPFHHKAFRYNQFASNLTRWRETTETEQVIVSHNVTNYEFFYEPFYIARDDVAPHDERFLGYGFTRNTQVYEMALAGWSFQVLSPIFSIHWGLQMKQRRQPNWRKTQMDANRRLFDVINNEMKIKYGHKSTAPTPPSAKLP